MVCSLQKNVFLNYSKSDAFFSFHLFSRLPTCMQKQKFSLKIECNEKASFKTSFFFQSPFFRSHPPQYLFPTFSYPLRPLFAPKPSPDRTQSLRLTLLHPLNTSQEKKNHFGHSFWPQTFYYLPLHLGHLAHIPPEKTSYPTLYLHSLDHELTPQPYLYLLYLFWLSTSQRGLTEPFLWWVQNGPSIFPHWAPKLRPSPPSSCPNPQEEKKQPTLWTLWTLFFELGELCGDRGNETNLDSFLLRFPCSQEIWQKSNQLTVHRQLITPPNRCEITK